MSFATEPRGRIHWLPLPGSALLSHGPDALPLNDDLDELESRGLAWLRRQACSPPPPIELAFSLDDAPARLLLICVSERHRGLTLPVGRGRTLVGSGQVVRYAPNPRVLRGVVEGVQWEFRVDESATRVRDIDSTNGSLLVPRASRHEVFDEVPGWPTQRSGFAPNLGWDGRQKHEDAMKVASGDLLFSVYCCFLVVERSRSGAVGEADDDQQGIS